MTQTVLLGDIAYVTKLAGYEFTKYISYDDNGEIIALRALNLRDGRLDLGDIKRISRDVSEKLPRSQLKKGDILLSYTGTVGNFAMVEQNDTYHLAPNVCLIRSGQDCAPEFLYYIIASPSFKNQLLGSSHGSTQVTVPMKNIRQLKIDMPDIEAQKKIANILGTIDEKIELNRKMNETLEQMGQALFRHYFIDNPETEKWDDDVLGNIIVNFDSKRKPLSSRQRAETKGEYRYFGATSVMDYVNDYLFDGKYLLLAEDGSVIKDDSTPYLQYIWGKFWVNNHAHILQAKEPFTVEYLYLLLSMSNVQSLVSGAVQLKINQKAMNSFKIKMPPVELVTNFCEKVDSMFAQRRKNEEEIQTLTTLRDTLLPRLISGKVKV